MRAAPKKPYPSLPPHLCGRGSTPMVPFWGRCTTDFSRVGIGLFTGGTIWPLTHGHVPTLPGYGSVAPPRGRREGGGEAALLQALLDIPRFSTGRGPMGWIFSDAQWISMGNKKGTRCWCWLSYKGNPYPKKEKGHHWATEFGFRWFGSLGGVVVLVMGEEEPQIAVVLLASLDPQKRHPRECGQWLSMFGVWLAAGQTTGRRID